MNSNMDEILPINYDNNGIGRPQEVGEARKAEPWELP